MEFGSGAAGSSAGRRIAMVLCAAVAAAGLLEPFGRDSSSYAAAFAPNWIPLAAVALAAAGIASFGRRRQWPRLARALLWGGLLMMVWASSGLPLDLLRLPGLIGIQLMPPGIDWPGLVRRTLALAAAIALARLALAQTPGASPTRPGWYGYAAFVLALPYPVLRMHWSLGGTLGLSRPGAAGEGFAPLVLTAPFLLAAVLSLLLVSPPRWVPRRLLLAAGWSATAILAMIGPAACWTLVSALAKGSRSDHGEIATWVFGLFYGSWFLLAIAAGAATRRYQLRSAPTPEVPAAPAAHARA